MVRIRRGLRYVLEWWLQLPWPPSLRARWLRRMGAHVGAQVRIHRCQLMNLDTPNGFRNLTVGDRAHIGPGCILDLANSLEVGSRATISPGVMVLTHADAGHAAVAHRFPRVDAATKIGEDAWVGAGAIILAGSHVGSSAVVGAGSVVGEPVQRGSVVAGVPARPMGDAH